MIKLLATAAFGFGLEPVSIKKEAAMNNSCREPAQKPAVPIRAAAGLAQKLLAAGSILGAQAVCIRPLPNRPILLLERPCGRWDENRGHFRLWLESS